MAHRHSDLGVAQEQSTSTQSDERVSVSASSGYSCLEHRMEPLSSTLGRLPERTNGPVLKTVRVQAHVGPNPTPSAIRHGCEHRAQVASSSQRCLFSSASLLTGMVPAS